MTTLVKHLDNKSQVVFDKGKFDHWCVYITNEKRKEAPADIDYFSQLKLLSYRYPQGKIYNDFLKIYTLTSRHIESKVIQLIDQICLSYKWNDASIIEQWLTVLYAAMIAEENKEKAILKKRIKRLGLYQLFFQDFSASEAANYSKGKSWRELDKTMKALGF